MMDVNLLNQTKTSNGIINPTLIWCFIMPFIHILSLISNILCIIVFCSKTFIHKPIAIYFICLLISDSTTTLIGYIEMLDRESYMIDKSSLLCMFNERVIHNLADYIYTFMGRFCLEWMLYKVLWTRASTILLAILSIQRSRTFFSLSYRESRLCAIFACLISVFIALFITCLEWTGIQCEKSSDTYIYMEIFQLIMNKKVSKEFYSNYLYNHYNQSGEKYYCIIRTLDINRLNMTTSVTNQFNCSTTEISSQFHSLTQSLLSNRDSQISESMNNILTYLFDGNFNYSNASLLTAHIKQAESSEILIKLFDKRPCHVTLVYSVCLKLFSFLHSLSFGFNRHTIAIFFGNALPSFIVLSANLLSIKVIYFSKSLKYLRETATKNRRKSRLQNDLRAFLVILSQSFSVITISWGIPIALTMYHCHTLYVISIAACPRIKTSLAVFLYTDLFNSSTNCLLYSLSGKLFRRKYISIIKAIFTCCRGTLWNVQKQALLSRRQQLELQQSNEVSTNINCGTNSRTGSCGQSECLTSVRRKQLRNITINKKLSDDDHSLNMVRISDEQAVGTEIELEPINKAQLNQTLKNVRSFKQFLIDTIQSFGSSNNTESKKEKKMFQIFGDKRQQVKHKLSPASSSLTGNSECTFQRQQSLNKRFSSTILLNNVDDNQSITNENVTSL